MTSHYICKKNFGFQIPVEQHATTREGPVKGVCYAAFIKSKCDDRRLLTTTLFHELNKN